MRFAPLALALFLAGQAGSLRADVEVPVLRARVTDLTGTLSADQRAALETKLQAFEQRRGSQVAVLIVPTTQPEAIEQYSIRVVQAWKLGRKGVDDGALLLVAKDDRKLRIEVGYGLEGALNDATANRIIDEVIKPEFRGGNFYRGIDLGTDRMISVIDGELLPEPQQQSGRQRNVGSIGQLLPILFIFTFVVSAFLQKIFGQLPGAIFTGLGAGFLAWLVVSVVTISVLAAVLAFIFSLLSGATPGRWSNRGGPYWGGGLGGGGFGGGGGGFGGGGFGGGGGGFGGGGASGNW
jgi:uncharacterized protein